MLFLYIYLLICIVFLAILLHSVYLRLLILRCKMLQPIAPDGIIKVFCICNWISLRFIAAFHLCRPEAALHSEVLPEAGWFFRPGGRTTVQLMSSVFCSSFSISYMLVSMLRIIGSSMKRMRKGDCLPESADGGRWRTRLKSQTMKKKSQSL